MIATRRIQRGACGVRAGFCLCTIQSSYALAAEPRVRDDGNGIDPAVLASQGIQGHYGLRGMPARAALVGGELAVLSEVGTGTEVELRVPARAVYATSRRGSWLSRRFASKTPA